jgi:hypothetical protein
MYELEVASDVRATGADAAVIRRHRVGKRYRDLHTLHCHVREPAVRCGLPDACDRVCVLTWTSCGVRG